MRRSGALVAALLALFAVAAVVSVSSSSDARTLVAQAVAVMTGLLAGAIVLSRLGSAETARRQAALERDDLQDRLEDLTSGIAARESLLATLREGVALFDPHGRVAYANAALQELLGRRFESISEVVPAALRTAILEAAESRGMIERELAVGERMLRAAATPAPVEGTVVLVVRDVTAARRIEQLRRDFVANASHELKTPVASMVALSETMTGAARDPDAMRRFLDRLQQESSRLASLVQDLLSLSRLEEGTPPLTLVEFHRVIGLETERLLARAGKMDVRIVVEELEPAVVKANEQDLGLLVHNLVDNAVRYTAAGGKVRVSLRLRGDHTIFRVADTGIGIPSRDLNRIFERFYRVDAARSRETGGTGLGLSIVRHVAESLGGKASVTSALGVGSTFTVEIPLAPEADHSSH